LDLREGHLQPRGHRTQQQFAYTTGKNASDITLVIDAMDLLDSGRFDGFCLVSSDNDFMRLAARIREQDACRRFIYAENLLHCPRSRFTHKPLQQPSAAVPIIRRVIAQMES
jgi:hypothetical protein